MNICADMHTHTVASTHAYSTITENAAYAKEIGLKAIAMTDHAPTMWDSPHIWHFNNMRILPRKIHDVTVIRGAEVNIVDTKGKIDLNAHALSYCEWVIASMHGPCIKSGTIEENTEAYINVAENPDVDCIGHCTTNEYVFDYETALKAFKANNKVVEINESSISQREGALDNARKVLEICKDLKMNIVLNSDGHFWSKIGYLPTAKQLVKEIDYPEELILNADWDRLKSFILAKRPDALK